MKKKMLMTRRECLARLGAAAGAVQLASLVLPRLRGQSANLDRFGIQMLYPTVDGGRTWFSSWDNGQPRTLTSGQRDPWDSEFIVRGNDGPPYSVTIDGNGLAIMSGDAPRMYVYDPQQIEKWQNVEVTFYGQRVSETGFVHSQGFVAGARSEHQNSNVSECSGQTYYGRMLYDGRINFQKEVVYEDFFSTNKPTENGTYDWLGGNTLPFNLWIGYKFVVRNINDNSNVKLSLYRDLSGGSNGGDWVKMVEYLDAGNWLGEPDTIWTPAQVETNCHFPSTRIFTQPATSVFIRNDQISQANYKQFSIREIQPDPALYNFENDVQSWVTNDPAVSLLSSSDHAYAGQASLGISFDASQLSQSQVYVSAPPVTPGSQLKFYVWIPSGTGLASINPFVEDGNWNWTDNWRAVSDLVPDSWNEFIVAVPSDANLPFARLGVEFTSVSPWVGMCYVDSVGVQL